MRYLTIHTFVLLSILGGACSPRVDEAPLLPAAKGETGTTDVKPLFVDFGFVEPFDDGRDASAHAKILDFTFSGKLVVEQGKSEYGIRNQLMYTQGQLNGDQSGPKLQYAKVSDVEITQIDDGKELVFYQVTLTVAWGRSEVPPDYRFYLPITMSYQGRESFYNAYVSRCTAPGAHDLSAAYFWYDYRPRRESCRSALEADTVNVFVSPATVVQSTAQTFGKHPEYKMVWNDGLLQGVIVFGKDNQGSEDPWDGGTRDYNNFISSMESYLQNNRDQIAHMSMTPNPLSYGPTTTNVKFEAEFNDGRKLVVATMLVEHITQPGNVLEEFPTLTANADFIAYNGHSGLGRNIGRFGDLIEHRSGQYSVMFLNGCDTYSYIAENLIAPRSEKNPDDPEGTKYLDIVLNAMPAYMDEGAPATMALIEGLMSQRKTYEEIFVVVDPKQKILVMGEQDNTPL